MQRTIAASDVNAFVAVVVVPSSIVLRCETTTISLCFGRNTQKLHTRSKPGQPHQGWIPCVAGSNVHIQCKRAFVILLLKGVWKWAFHFVQYYYYYYYYGKRVRFGFIDFVFSASLSLSVFSISLHIRHISGWLSEYVCACIVCENAGHCEFCEWKWQTSWHQQHIVCFTWSTLCTHVAYSMSSMAIYVDSIKHHEYDHDASVLNQYWLCFLVLIISVHWINLPRSPWPWPHGAIFLFREITNTSNVNPCCHCFAILMLSFRFELPRSFANERMETILRHVFQHGKESFSFSAVRMDFVVLNCWEWKTWRRVFNCFQFTKRKQTRVLRNRLIQLFFTWTFQRIHFNSQRWKLIAFQSSKISVDQSVGCKSGFVA